MADMTELENMSDEEFLKAYNEEEPEEQNVPDETDTPEDVDTSGSEEDASDSGSNEEENKADAQPDTKEDASSSGSDTEEQTVQIPALENAEQYEQFYKTVMAPIKANGKLIKLNSANDVISLIQQGANYTKKMQSIAPYRKQLKMLEDNDLLDNDKLRFLVDVAKGDKDAIKKLLADSKIDANDLSGYDDDEELDEEGNPKPKAYYPKTPTVSDQEVAWSDAWKELLEQEKLDNVDTHSVIMNMDAASQRQVYENPQILGLMHMTQACGAYDKIVAEMDRLKTLGYIQDNAPWLSTFIEVKNLMLQHGMLNDEVAKLQGGNAPQPVGKAPATKKNTMANDKKARAAAPSRSSGKSTKPFLNPLNMSDEEFLMHYDEI